MESDKLINAPIRRIWAYNSFGQDVFNVYVGQIVNAGKEEKIKIDNIERDLDYFSLYGEIRYLIYAVDLKDDKTFLWRNIDGKHNVDLEFDKNG